VFGWGSQSMPIAGADYTVVDVRGHSVGGIRAPMPGEGPAWSTYVRVEDADETARRVDEHPAAGRMLAFEYLRPFG